MSLLAERARRARRVGICARLGAGEGMACPGGVWFVGPDAASFLHSQTTNDVKGLSVGAGHLNARVTRTGHLVEVFSLHCLGADRYLALLPADRVDSLIESLDAFLFADEVTISRLEADWAVFVGPDAVAGLTTKVPEASELDENAVLESEGRLFIRRSITGDDGFLVTEPSLVDEVAGSGVEEVSSEAFAEILDVLRIEAGLIRVGPDTPGRGRLLPETGLEQRAVSYTKGCYIGQEVIARIRTYGSVPNALRAVVLPSELPLSELPAPGEVLRDHEGKKRGFWASRTWSPVCEAPAALVYLDRSARTPGTELELETVSGRAAATVVLLPIYRAPNQAERVSFLYDRAIRVFAGGNWQGSLTLLDEALRLDPGFADAYEVTGVIFGREGLFHEAIDFFRRLEEVAPDEPMVNTNLSLYYMKLGDRSTAEAQAAKALQKSMARGRGDGSTAADVAREQEEARRRDAERKREMFGRVLEFDPVDSIALFGMGKALTVLDRLEEAAEVLARAVEADRSNSAVYLARGKALEGCGMAGEALAVYRAGMEVASRRGDLMPLREMEHRVLLLGVDPYAESGEVGAAE